MRLIDADTLMKELAEFVKDSNNSDFADVPTWNDAVSLVGSAPTIEERKRGKWLRKLSQTPWPICSECGIYGANESNYCPNCGADMRGGKEDGE